MKYTIHILFVIVLLAGHNLHAQNNTKTYDASGIKVIHKTVPGDVIAVRMYVRGGTANYPREKEGIENLAFEVAMFGGTSEHSAEEIQKVANSLGIGLSSKSGYDYGFLGMTALKMYWDESWELWAEAVGLPAMDNDDFERIRDQIYARNRRSNTSPENYIDQFSMTSTFAGTNYEKIPEGSTESLYDITLEDVQNHYNMVMNKSNVFVVVVGNVSESDVKKKVQDSFGEFPAGTPRSALEKSTVKNPSVSIQHRDLDINYIQGRMPAPNRWSSEGIHNMLAMSLLSDRYVEELRTKRDLSYSPSAFAGTQQMHPSNGLFVSTISPVTSVKLMVEIIDEVRRKGFTEKELEKKRNTFLVYHFLGQETSDAQAHALGDAEAGMTWQSLNGFSDAVRVATVADVNAVFKKYNNTISWSYLGNESQIQTSDFPQPKPLEEPNNKEVEEVPEAIEPETEDPESE